ncbi:MAG: response regulator transcription factor [Acidobacteria bacterium]|nr:response regulator transcription factor [Acidobacteriota bacterium]
MVNKGRILIVEDELDIANLIRIHLGDLGYDIEIAGDGKLGLQRALEENWSLVILDLMLPEIDGFEVCKRIRAENEALPILMLTARADELDKVLGLELGADDYLTKPFSVRELLARVKALFRRVEAFGAEATTAKDTITAGDLVIDRQRREARLSGEVVNLTAKEFDLLAHFAGHPGQVFTRSQLLDQVWGYVHEGYEHTVNTHINRLRRKIEPDPAKPRYVITVWGVGYRFPGADELKEVERC